MRDQQLSLDINLYYPTEPWVKELNPIINLVGFFI
jgi:hypothetical protein